MNQTVSLLLRGAAALLLTAGVVRAQSETFSTPGDDRGWTGFGIAASTEVTHNGSGALAFSATDYSEFYLIADAGASDGLFTGSYTGYASVEFDLFLDGELGVDTVQVRLADSVNFNEWTYLLNPLTVGGTGATYSVPLDPSGAGWVQVAGPDSFATFLGSVDEFSLVFLPLDVEFLAEGLAGTIDNVGFTPVPEPSTVALLAGVAALGGVLVARRRRVS